MFSDPVFEKLGVSHARLAVSGMRWSIRGSTRRSTRGSTSARRRRLAADRLRPLARNRRKLPTPARFKYDFRQFRARYPWVTTFATWNEANHAASRLPPPAARRGLLPRDAARVPQCTILAAEMLDMPNMASWVDAFQQHLGPGNAPRYWGLHNYIDANRLRTTGTRTMIKHAKGQIWFTETGGIVNRHNKSKVGFPESAAHAAIATRWVFDDLVPLSRRITRVYLYHWNAISGDNWDSGVTIPAVAPVRRSRSCATSCAPGRRASAGGRWRRDCVALTPRDWSRSAARGCPRRCAGARRAVRWRSRRRR